MKSFLKASTLMFLGILIGAVLLYVYQMCNRPDLKTWHVTELSAEVTEKDIKGMSRLQDYLDRENILFQQLHEQLYKDKSGLPSVGFNRYLSGSWSDPRRFSPDTPFYLVGYSNGAALALEYTMAEILGEDLRRPDGLVLIFPSVLTSKVAALEKGHLLLARIPEPQKLACLNQKEKKVYCRYLRQIC